jgi:hypothetical protein
MEPDKMCKQNGLLQRGSTYFFQARIPKDCKAFFSKAVIREKLTATTHTKAKAQVRQKLADLEAILEQITFDIEVPRVVVPAVTTGTTKRTRRKG